MKKKHYFMLFLFLVHIIYTIGGLRYDGYVLDGYYNNRNFEDVGDLDYDFLTTNEIEIKFFKTEQDKNDDNYFDKIVLKDKEEIEHVIYYFESKPKLEISNIKSLSGRVVQVDNLKNAPVFFEMNFISDNKVYTPNFLFFKDIKSNFISIEEDDLININANTINKLRYKIYGKRILYRYSAPGINDFFNMHGIDLNYYFDRQLYNQSNPKDDL